MYSLKIKLCNFPFPYTIINKPADKIFQYSAFCYKQPSFRLLKLSRNVPCTNLERFFLNAHKGKILLKLPPSRDAENLFLPPFDNHGIIIINRAGIRGKVFVVRNLKFAEFLVFEENRVIVRDYEVDCYTRAGKLSSLTNFPCSLKFYSISPLNQIVCLLFLTRSYITFKCIYYFMIIHLVFIYWQFVGQTFFPLS